MATKGSIPSSGDRGKLTEAQAKARNRVLRGRDLFRDGAFERISSDIFVVENPKTRGVYRVNLAKGICECEDHRRHGGTCKHLIAATLYQRWLRRVAKVVAMSGAVV